MYPINYSTVRISGSNFSILFLIISAGHKFFFYSTKFLENMVVVLFSQVL